MIYTCIRCGNKFESKHKTAVCDNCHTAVCVICGKVFDLQYPWTQVTCSAECRGKYRKISGVGKSASRKAQNTRLIRGTVYKFSTKICKFCGKEFTPTSSRQIYCTDIHYGPCPVCGKLTKITDMSVGPTACSTQCKLEQTKKTCLEKYGSEYAITSDHAKIQSVATCREKYGVDHYSQTQEYKDKYICTSLEKYGTVHPMKSDELKDKVAQTNTKKYGGKSPSCDPSVKAKAASTIQQSYGGFGFSSEFISKKISDTMMDKYGTIYSMQNRELRSKAQGTNLAKYGVENPMQNADIRSRAESTSLKKYGVPYPSQADLIKEKVRNTVKSRYGVSCVFQSPDIQELSRKTLLERYGQDNPMKVESIRSKAMQTNVKRYGSPYYTSSVSYTMKRISDPSKADQFIEFTSSPKDYILSHYVDKPTLTQLADSTGVDIATISSHIISSSCQDLISYRKSTMEVDVVQFLKSTVPNINILRNDRTLINPLEVDIYLPDYNLAIECNPTVTHNSSVMDPFGGPPKDYRYHQRKSLLCSEKGVFLFHIFGYEWTTRRSVIESMLRNLLHANSDKIYARKCNIKVISNYECKNFLDNNHRQGGMNSKVRLGLYYNDELVSVMTFNRVRGTIGRSDNSNQWELSRFCNKLNTSVVGGASKLLSYFQKHYSYSSIVSYSDVSHTLGNLYSRLGFTQSEITYPGYVWVKLDDDSYLNRVSCQKSRLVKRFPDFDVMNNTEAATMEAHGYVRVYDSGVIRWEKSFQ